MVIETKVVIGWFKLQFRMWLVDLNHNWRAQSKNDPLIIFIENVIDSLNCLITNCLLTTWQVN